MMGIRFNKSWELVVVNERIVNFWIDRLCRSETLGESFTTLFSLLASKGVVAEARDNIDRVRSKVQSSSNISMIRN